MRARAPLGAVVLAFVVSRLWLAFGFVPQHPESEVYRRYALLAAWGAAHGRTLFQANAERFAAAAAAGRAPAAETRVIEYPPLGLVPILAPAWLAPPPESGDAATRAAWNRVYTRLFRLELLLVDGATFALVLLLVARWYGDEPPWRRALRAGAYVAGGLFACEVLYDRIDLVLGALVLAALALSWSRARAGWALGLLALAVGYKLAPLTLVPLFVLAALPALTRPQARRAAGYAALAALLIALVLALPAARWGGDALAFVGYHGARGLQVESPLASLAMLAAAVTRRPLGVHRGFGAAELDAPGAATLAALSPLLLLLAVAAATLLIARSLGALPADGAARLAQRAPRLVAAGVALLLLATMIASKVLSPQYLLWLLPLAPLLPLRVGWGLVAVCALTTLIVPWLYASQVLRLHPGVLPPVGDGPTLLGGALLAARNGALCLLAAALVPRRAARPS
jgi:hypothetical protein